MSFNAEPHAEGTAPEGSPEVDIEGSASELPNLSVGESFKDLTPPPPTSAA